MSTTAVILLIVFVLAIIVGNILLLRRSTHFPRPKSKDNDETSKNQGYKKGFDDEEDDW